MAENLDSSENKEFSLEQAIKSKIKEVEELIDVGFMKPGDPYGVEALYADIFHKDSVDSWHLLDNQAKNNFLKNLGNVFGTDLLNFSEKDVIEELENSGVKGEKTEEGLVIKVLRTNNPLLDVHVSEGKNPKIGKEYYLVVREKGGE